MHSKAPLRPLLLDRVHQDMVAQQFVRLDPKSYASLMRLSKRTLPFFDRPEAWQDKLHLDFGFNFGTLAGIAHIVRPESGGNAYKENSKLIYKRLRRVVHGNVPDYIKQSWRCEHNREKFLACCTDDAAVVPHLPFEEYHLWYTVAVCAGCINIPLALFTKLQTPAMKKRYLRTAIDNHHSSLAVSLLQSDATLSPDLTNLHNAVTYFDLRLVRFLMDKVGLKPDLRMLHNAIIWSGGFDLVFYLLTNHRLVPNGFTLNFAAQSGDLKLVRYLIDTFGLLPDEYTLGFAAHSGNFDLVCYLIDNYKLTLEPNILHEASSHNTLLVQFLLVYLKPDLTLWYNAARSGNIEILLLLLKRESDFSPGPEDMTAILKIAASHGKIEFIDLLLKSKPDLSPDKETLQFATISGNLKLVRFLIDTFDLLPDQETLCFAALSGDLDLVRFLIDTFNLLPDQETLVRAVHSGNLDLLRFLLDPGFKLSPDDATLAAADSSINLAIKYHLLPCAMAMNEALRHLEQDQLETASACLKQAQQLAPLHVAQVCDKICSHPAEYRLSDKQVAWLKCYFTKAQILETPTQDSIVIGNTRPIL